MKLRAALVLEEALEFVHACGLEIQVRAPNGSTIEIDKTNVDFVPNENGADWPEMIDAICDLHFVVFGSAAAMGVDTDPFFAEVERTNLEKTKGEVRADGKRLKPPGWQPPRIRQMLIELLRSQCTCDQERYACSSCEERAWLEV